MKAMKKMMVVGVAVGLVLGLGGVAAGRIAPNKVWLTDGGDWGDPANWSPAGVPGPSDSVCIKEGRTAIITSVQPEVILGVTVPAASWQNGTVKMQSGAALSVGVDGIFLATQGDEWAWFEQSGGSLNCSGIFRVGSNASNGSGTYRMIGGTGSTTLDGKLEFGALGKLELQPTGLHPAATDLRPFVVNGTGADMIALTPGATLDVDFLTGNPYNSTIFTVIDNNSGSAITGQFTYAHGGLLGEDATFSVPAFGGGTVDLTIHYTGGGGSDLTLVVSKLPAGDEPGPVPEPAALGLLGMALLVIKRRRV